MLPNMQTKPPFDFIDLMNIVNGHRFHPVYQPIVLFPQSIVVGYEALTRFDDDVSPLEAFHSLSPEETSPLELAAFHAALEGAVDLLLPGQFLALNLSGYTIINCSQEIQAATLALQRQIVIELTEPITPIDYQKLNEALQNLRTGIDVAIDDLGSAQVTLHDLIKVRPHYVKLDLSMVSGVHKDDYLTSLISGLAEFAHKTRCELIAEGVESEMDRDKLISVGVNLQQGYLLGYPETADKVRRYLD